MEGFVYILRNPGMPGLLKIGCSTRSPIERASELFTTAVPYKFEIVFAVYAKDCQDAENNIHEALDEYRCIANREFFKISEDEAITHVINECVDEGMVCAIDPLVIRPWLLDELCEKTGMHVFCFSTLIRFVKPEAWLEADVAFKEWRDTRYKAADNG